jgi:hypothetical protein
MPLKYYNPTNANVEEISAEFLRKFPRVKEFEFVQNRIIEALGARQEEVFQKSRRIIPFSVDSLTAIFRELITKGEIPPVIGVSPATKPVEQSAPTSKDDGWHGSIGIDVSENAAPNSKSISEMQRGADERRKQEEAARDRAIAAKKKYEADLEAAKHPAAPPEDGTIPLGLDGYDPETGAVIVGVQTLKLMRLSSAQAIRKFNERADRANAEAARIIREGQ